MSTKHEEVLARLSEYFEGELSDKETEEFKAHIDSCSECREEFELLSRTVKLLGALGEEQVPAGLRANILAEIEKENWWTRTVRALFGEGYWVPARALAYVFIAVFVGVMVYQSPFTNLEQNYKDTGRLVATEEAAHTVATADIPDSIPSPAVEGEVELASTSAETTRPEAAARTIDEDTGVADAEMLAEAVDGLGSIEAAGAAGGTDLLRMDMAAGGATGATAERHEAEGIEVPPSYRADGSSETAYRAEQPEIPAEEKGIAEADAGGEDDAKEGERLAVTTVTRETSESLDDNETRTVSPDSPDDIDKSLIAMEEAIDKGRASDPSAGESEEGDLTFPLGALVSPTPVVDAMEVASSPVPTTGGLERRGVPDNFRDRFAPKPESQLPGAPPDGNAPAPPDTISDDRLKEVAAQGTQIPFEAEYADLYGGVKTPRQLIVQDAGSFAAIWNKAYGNRSPLPEVPAIDFSDHFAVAVFMGERSSGGFKIRIEKVTWADGKIVVSVDQAIPDPGSAVTLALTQPFHIVVMPRQVPNTDNWVDKSVPVYFHMK